MNPSLFRQKQPHACHFETHVPPRRTLARPHAMSAIRLCCMCCGCSKSKSPAPPAVQGALILTPPWLDDEAIRGRAPELLLLRAGLRALLARPGVAGAPPRCQRGVRPPGQARLHRIERPAATAAIS